MTDTTIAAALDAAAKRLCICDGECFETRHGMMHGPCEARPKKAAAAGAGGAAVNWQGRIIGFDYGQGDVSVEVVGHRDADGWLVVTALNYLPRRDPGAKRLPQPNGANPPHEPGE